MSQNFYTPKEVRPIYKELIPVYQAAFAAPPWNEVSKCADAELRCLDGLSDVAIGGTCDTCRLCPTQPAYEADELIERFEELRLTRPTAWYVERNDSELSMAAIAWKALPTTIVTEKYPDIPEMNYWIPQKLGNEEVMWLDEVFADRQIKPMGNLKNFGKFVLGLASRLDCETVAYRTIEPRMTAVAKRDFGENALISKRITEVPDWRDIVIINSLGGKL